MYFAIREDPSGNQVVLEEWCNSGCTLPFSPRSPAQNDATIKGDSGGYSPWRRLIAEEDCTAEAALPQYDGIDVNIASQPDLGKM
ncbi:MAG: hypothetical protein WAM65_02895 [Candidatus Korobacteraceae bacterium]